MFENKSIRKQNDDQFVAEIKRWITEYSHLHIYLAGNLADKWFKSESENL